MDMPVKLVQPSHLHCTNWKPVNITRGIDVLYLILSGIKRFNPYSPPLQFHPDVVRLQGALIEVTTLQTVLIASSA